MAEPPTKKQRGEPHDSEQFVYILDDEEEEGETSIQTNGKQDMESWLDSIGLSHYSELFDAAEIDVSLVAHLTSEDLIELGISSLEERQLILSHAKKQPGEMSGPHPCSASHQLPPPTTASSSKGISSQPEELAMGSNIFRQPDNRERDRGRITSFFPILRQGQERSSLVEMRPIGVRYDPSSSYRATPAPASAPGPAPASAPGPAPGPALAPFSLASTSSVSSSSNTLLLARARSCPLPTDTTLSKNIPRWKKLPGSKMTVDCFSEFSRDLKGCTYWVLSHFHSDH